MTNNPLRPRERQPSGWKKLGLDEARKFAGRLSTGITSLASSHDLSAADEKFISRLNIDGGSLIVNLVNSGSVLPPAEGLEKQFNRLAESGWSIYFPGEQFLAGIQSPEDQGSVIRVMQEHVGWLSKIGTSELYGRHRAGIIGSAAVVVDIIGDFVSSNDGLNLDPYGQQYEARLNELYAATSVSDRQ